MTSIAQNTKDYTIGITWANQDNEALNLSGVSTVKGVLRSGSSGSYTDTTLTGAIAVTDANAGLLQWTISAADSANAGSFLLFLFANFASGAVLPSLGYRLDIEPAPTIPA